jgi:hypothetical protein
MVTDRGGPDPGAQLDLLEALSGKVLHRMVHQSPIYEILGMKDRKTRSAVEARSCHPVVLPDTDHIRIGVIGVEDRIAVATVTEIGTVGIGIGMAHKFFIN